MLTDSVLFASDRVIVMAAPNGARRTRRDHPAIPLTADEIGHCAGTLLDAGASVLHLHVRDRKGRHSLDPAHYREAIRAVRQSVGDELVIQVTTEAAGLYSPEEQMAMVTDLRPEAVSLGLRELCPDHEAETRAGAFFAGLRGSGTWPQYILYSVDDVTRFHSLRRKGFFGEDHPFCLLVLGRYSAALEGSVDELASLLEAFATNTCPWAACCFGRHEHAAMLAAARAGGHVRLGFENNLLLADGSEARDNGALIRQFTESLASTGRRPARAGEIRATWQL